MGSSKPPVTQADWDRWELERKGLIEPTPEPRKPTTREFKIKDAARNRKTRAHDANKRMKRSPRLATVVDLKSATPPPERNTDVDRVIGETEKVWLEQCELSGRADSNPMVVALGQRAAQILDKPDEFAMWPTTIRQLQALNAVLSGSTRKSRAKGRLVSIQRMTAKNRAVNE